VPGFMRLENNSFLIAQGSSGQVLIHSVRLANSPLTFSYWDYLAWAIYRANPTHWLLLGLGGGTTLQLLTQWGVTSPCLGVEIDQSITEEVLQHGWITYPSLKIVYMDAREFLRKPGVSDYSAIVVDLYDEQGFVEDLYFRPGLELLLECLRPGGVLLLHCWDPCIKFLGLGRFASPPPRSATCRIIAELESVAPIIHVYPLWTSALVVVQRAAETAGTAKWLKVAQRPLDSNDVPAPLFWFDSFVRARELDPEDLLQDFRMFEDRLSYDRLQGEDRHYLSQLLPLVSIQEGAEPGISQPTPLQAGQRHSFRCCWRTLPDVELAYVRAGILFHSLKEKYGSMVPKGEAEELARELSVLANEFPSSRMRQLYSFVLAMSLNWDEAIRVLDG